MRVATVLAFALGTVAQPTLYDAQYDPQSFGQYYQSYGDQAYGDQAYDAQGLGAQMYDAQALGQTYQAYDAQALGAQLYDAQSAQAYNFQLGAQALGAQAYNAEGVGQAYAQPLGAQAYNAEVFGQAYDAQPLGLYDVQAYNVQAQPYNTPVFASQAYNPQAHNPQALGAQAYNALGAQTYNTQALGTQAYDPQASFQFAGVPRAAAFDAQQYQPASQVLSQAGPYGSQFSMAPATAQAAGARQAQAPQPPVNQPRGARVQVVAPTPASAYLGAPTGIVRGPVRPENFVVSSRPYSSRYVWNLGRVGFSPAQAQSSLGFWNNYGRGFGTAGIGRFP